MTKTLANYLGRPAYTMLEDEPFKDWAFEKSYDEDDPEDLSFNYVVLQHGLSVRSDCDDKITVIFLHSDRTSDFDECLPFSWSRRKVIERFGVPSKSGAKSSSPILGEYGPWDRFARTGHTIHVEYSADADRIRVITLMRDDVVPC